MDALEKLPPFFDAASAWAAMSPEQQAEWGRVALTLGCAAHGVADGLEGEPYGRACEATVDEATTLLGYLYAGLFPADDADLSPDLNAIGVRACTSCGCTDNRACDEGCWWSAETLCSSCAARPPSLSAAGP